MLPRLAPVAAIAVLLAVWAIALSLYLLKPRRRRVLVPFMPLWEALLLPEPTTRLFGRLRRTGSLLIALLLTGLLVLALTDPRPGLFSRAPRTLLVLIDAGQHMQATDVLPSRLERARELAQQLVVAKANADEVLIAQMDATVTALGPLSADAHTLQAALKRLAATDAATDFGAAAEFALQTLDGRPNPALMLISDGVFAAETSVLDALRAHGIQLHQLAVGKSARNVGIRSFSARRYRGDKTQSEAMLEIENAGARSEHVELRLLGDDAALAVAQLDLPAHSVVSRFYSDVPAHAQRLEAQIALRAGRDPLASDDRAYALLPPATRTRILLVTNGNRYLEAALLLDAARELRVIKPSAYRDAAGYDLVLFDRFAPAAAPGVPSLFIAPPANPNDFPLRIRGVVDRPSFDTFVRDHPLLRHIALRDVNISSALRVQPQAGDRIVAAAGTTPLIVTGQRAGQPYVALSFDIRESDLPLRVAWPLLVSHAIDFLRPPDVDYLPTLRIGLEQRLRVGRSSARAVLQAPHGERESLAVQQQAVWLRPLHAGFYRLEVPGEPRLWAANRDPERTVSIEPGKLNQARSGALEVANSWLPSSAWAGLLALVWAIAFLEWLSYQRRWTV
jgi:hypothetical protein